MGSVVFSGFVIAYLILGVQAKSLTEVVLVHDLNSDHHRRNLDAGLPPKLEFNVQRRSGAVRLTLDENTRVTTNAPVYEGKLKSNGKRTLIRKTTQTIDDEKFYIDKAYRGSFSLRCELSENGPCRRMVTGNFYINGRNYDISPTLEKISKRIVDSELLGVPHILVENKEQHEESTRMLQDTDAVDPSDKRHSWQRGADGRKEIPDGIPIPDVSHSWHRGTGGRKEIPDGIPIPDDSKFDEPHFLRALESILDQKWQEKQGASHRYKRSATLHDVEIMVVTDSYLWKMFYDDSTASEDGMLTREDVTEIKLRRYVAMVINGVSLRYQSIEDPDLQMFCTLSGLIINKEKNDFFPLPDVVETGSDGSTITEGGPYLSALRPWLETFEEMEPNDHVMALTGTNIYYIEEGEKATGLAGLAYVGGACGYNRQSLCEGTASFFTTTGVTAHELGHNLGASHDGSGSSANCNPGNNYIMMPYVAYFYETDPFNINPWRFSRCSVNAFKTYFASLGSENCLLNQGDIYNKAEYEEHTKKLPGEFHNVDAQCKLIQGENSKMCKSTDADNLCLVMKCLKPDGSCSGYTAARGTTCATDKWCIDGACITKTDPTQQEGCEDFGHAGHSCASLRDTYTSVTDFCHTWKKSCCKTCSHRCFDGPDYSQYTGTVSWTKYGRTCQDWTSQSPQEHVYDKDASFPADSSAAAAKNYCRDPDGYGKLWCYTINKDVRWEECDVPACPVENVDCYIATDAQQYKGHLNTVVDGILCMAWSEQTPQTHGYNKTEQFPHDESVIAANNYCRDPSKDGKPWCYTMQSGKRWEWCNVPAC